MSVIDIKDWAVLMAIAAFAHPEHGMPNCFELRGQLINFEQILGCDLDTPNANSRADRLCVQGFLTPVHRPFSYGVRTCFFYKITQPGQDAMQAKVLKP